MILIRKKKSNFMIRFLFGRRGEGTEAIILLQRQLAFSVHEMDFVSWCESLSATDGLSTSVTSQHGADSGSCVFVFQL